MAKMNQLRRYCRIVNKLSGRQKYVPFEELQAVIQGDMQEDKSCSLRTLQRDIRAIGELFGKEIKNARGRGYYIEESSPGVNAFDKLVSELEILSALQESPEVQEYVIPDHQQMRYSVDIGVLISAIRDCKTVRFSYFRPREAITSQYSVQPHWLKESQQRWYLVGYTDLGLRLFELGRITNLEITEETFARNNSVDVPALFRESFGIWNDPSMPVEEIVLRYDNLDARFLKTLPLHESQEVIEEDEKGITLRLHLRITNDFKMAILSRSRSVEVLAPTHLRRYIHDITMAASERNN